MSKILISFIIPAFNEELFLPQVIKCIHKHTPVTLPHEVIVVDNGSEDKTVELAKSEGAITIVDDEASIGGLRNIGVKVAKGSVLVFLDADILLTKEWEENITSVYNSILGNAFLVTGSRYGISLKPSFIEDIWFKPLVKKPSKYINSGHLITSRELFDAIDGFDATLETGEDYAFCQSAIQAKAVIKNNPSLAVVHKGYPKTIYQFMRREMWHGRGDCESLSGVLSSKVAMTSILFMLLHLAALVAFFVGSNVVPVVSLLLIASICTFSSVYKHDARSIKEIAFVSFLYYLYFFSRFLSCVSFMSNRKVKRKED